MNRFRVLVVDDEPLARGMVASLVRRDAEIEAVVESGDSASVPDLLARHTPHIVFLDIEMPGMDGLQLARLIDDSGPVIVFITAFSQYAARAFDVSAVDYVMKPFSDQRLHEALERAKRRVRERRLGELANKVASLSAELSGKEATPHEAAPAYPPRLAFKSGDRAIVLRPEEIVWVEAEDYYVLLHTVRGRHLVRVPLATLEERLDPRHFVRVHRAAIVNLQEVKELDARDGGATLVMSDGARVAVSRSRRRRVEELLLLRQR